MSDLINTTEQLFDDDLLTSLNIDDVFTDIYDNSIKYKFGDLLIFDKEENVISLFYKNFYNKKIKNYIVLGIIIKENDDSTIDLMLKNFLTANSIIIPINTHNYLNNMYNYIYQLFERYCNKFKRLSGINSNIFKFYIPTISQLDYIFKNDEILYKILETIWDTDKLKDFKTRLYNHGIICQYKNKLYQWLPIKDKKRQINNLDILTPYEFLPFFTITYN